MARKKKAVPAGAVVPEPRQPAPSPAGISAPGEVVQGDWTIAILAMTMLLAPALGVPNEEMLQDTLKSMVVSFGALGAAALFFWQQRNRSQALRWHALMWLPLGLMAYALGSMAWSHTYLAGVEAIRWFIFSLLLWLGLNTLSRDRVPVLARGIHWGAVVASLWAALQFWVDFKLFPQGPNPASTFVNRNFFAEFVVCTLPFSVLLLAQARSSSQVALLAFTTGFNIVAILMTGTRSALLALLALCVVLPVLLLLYRRQFAFSAWDKATRVLALGVLLITVLGMGLIPTGNSALVQDHATAQRGLTPLERSFSRTASMTLSKEYTEGSFAVRLVMWKATMRIIKERPLSGVGAGAWEVDIPLYQAEGSQLETDYYVHNEILQLLAEYGLLGWAFLLLLLAYLARAAWITWRARTPEELAEAPVRAIALAAMLAFLVVSNAGFPWRMASTGAMFALVLALLAASDIRVGLNSALLGQRLAWRPAVSRGLVAASLACTALALYISQKAIDCERDIVRAVRLALAVSADANPNDPRWDRVKADMLNLVERGIAVNPHYRKLTPMVADNLARWGDWRNAIWVWDSVATSRPYVVAILTNIARGYIQGRNFDAARAYLERARKIQPNALTVLSLEVILLGRTGREADAIRIMKSHFKDNVYDFDMANSAYLFGSYAKDWELALQGLQLIIKSWPDQAANAWVKTGNIYASSEFHDEAKALAAYRAAMDAAVTQPQRESTLKQIPAAFQGRL
ncbi:MAG TPA: O-antigen ligase family protein [Burkholderiaceae bacterium]|nr:O-antigen ligase family protein [Burkholderiaceae bacterium]